MSRRRLLTIVAAAALLAGCSGGGETSPGGSSGTSLSGQTVEVIGPWTGDEQDKFEKVLRAFEDRTGADVVYTPAGDELPTVLQTRIEGGKPPNIAMLAQPGLLAQLAEAGELKPLPEEIEQTVTAHNAPILTEFGSVNGTFYGVYFKAANKSTVWYNTKSFDQIGATPPATWEDFLTVGQSLADVGQAAVSIGGADGWTLTDWFENVYLRVAGPENYDKLSRHEIAWTDRTVRTSLEVLAQLFGDQHLVEGGAATALQTGFPDSVVDVFGDNPKAGMVFEADFVATVIAESTKSKVGRDAKFFPFPSINGSENAVVAGGDIAAAFTDDRATLDLMAYLASPDAGEVWAKLGGFLSPNKDIPRGAYPDEVTRELAGELVDAGDNIRFDMSDLAPSAFGGTPGAGEWKALQDFLANPTDIDATMRQLESEAAKAFVK